MVTEHLFQLVNSTQIADTWATPDRYWKVSRSKIDRLWRICYKDKRVGDAYETFENALNKINNLQ